MTVSVYEGSRQIISGLSNKELVKIKQDLTFDNPEYKSAKAFGRFQHVSANISPYITFYETMGDKLVVPRGYQIDIPHKLKRSTRQEHKVLYPKFKYSLREEQRKAYEALRESKQTSGLLVLGTGLGKSILGCYLASKYRQKTLVIVQKNDLIIGWQNDIQSSLGISKDNIGLIKAKSRKYGQQITLATIQTIAKLSTTEMVEVLNSFGMIIVDECHLSVAKSYDFLYHANAKYVLGLTATDTRADGLRGVMELQFGKVICRFDSGDDILPVEVQVIKTNLRYDGAVRYAYNGRIVDADYASYLHEMGKYVKRIGIDNHEREAVIAQDLDYNMQIVAEILKYRAQGKSVVVFSKTVDHITILYNLLSKKMPAREIGKFVGGINDKAFLDDAKSMKITVTLATFKKATEGTNVPVWEVGILASSLKQPKDVKQAIGRLRRKFGNKTKAIVIDFRHPFVQGYLTHERARDKAYRELDAKVIKESVRFSKGFV